MNVDVAVPIAIVTVAVAIALCGCGASCQTEQAAVEGLQTVMERTEDEDAREFVQERLEAAREAQTACEERERGDWLAQILGLVLKTAIHLAR